MTDTRSVITKRAQEVAGTWYHAGSDPREHTGYAHLGTREAAQSRGRTKVAVWRVTIEPRNPFNSPETRLEDWTANLISHFDAHWTWLGRRPEPEDLDYEFEDAPAVADELGWSPEHDAVYYENGVEDPGSTSVMVRASAITSAELL